MTKTLTALSTRQKRFVLSYCGHLNASRAARESGYSAASGADSVTACRLLRNNRVKAAIQALQQAKAEEMELTRQHVINEVLGAIQIAIEQDTPAEMIRGWVEVSKLCGFYDPASIKAEQARLQPDGKKEIRGVPTAELLQIIDWEGQYRNHDGSMMRPAQIDDFYNGLADAEIIALAEGRAKVVMRVEMLEGTDSKR